MRRVSRGARQELLAVIAERYRAAGRADKGAILNEFVVVTGYHRKHATRLLNNPTQPRQARHTASRGLYDEAVREALVVLWEASDRVCGKRLKPLLPLLIQAMERHGHLQLDDAVRERVLSISASTIDRSLSDTRAAIGDGPRAPARAKPAIRQNVPVRTFADWNDPEPGYMEGDLVLHCGGRVAGSFVQTLVLTDIASTWTECVALVVREGTLVVEALNQLLKTMPFPLRGLDTDNGGEFVNETVLAFCEAHRIHFTRSRPYRKNDQAWVEQKNGSVVRRLVGHRRLEGTVAVQALTRLYAASRLFVNFFQPSFKLIDKTRNGAKVHRRYDKPETPCARLLAFDAVPQEMKERLRSVAAQLDPLRLLDEIRAAQHELAAIAAGATPCVAPGRDADLGRFLQGLAVAWREGEVRPTHRAKPSRERSWRTRQDPFEAVWPMINGWLEDDPAQTAKQLLARLQSTHPRAFPDGLLRTLQRRVKAWRAAAARRLVFAGVSSSETPAVDTGGVETGGTRATAPVLSGNIPA